MRHQNETLYVNKVFKTKNYGCVKIIEYINNKNVTVIFEDTGYVCTVRLEHILNGDIRDRTKPTVHGVGYLGESPTVGIDGKHTKEYMLWKGVLERCYSKVFHKKRPSYIGCSTSENFKNYTYFVEWCKEQVGFNSEDDKGKSFELDKDILIKGNKVYSEDTCCFVPPEINLLFTKNDKRRGEYPVGVSFNKRQGRFDSYCCYNTSRYLGSYDTVEEAFIVYKHAKEAYIKEVANKWKYQIDPRVYDALMKYQVEITD